MTALQTLWGWLDGHKTYIASLSLGLKALYDYLNGDVTLAWQEASQALGLAGLRHALAKKGD